MNAANFVPEWLHLNGWTYWAHVDVLQFSEIVDKIGHYAGNQRKNSDGEYSGLLWKKCFEIRSYICIF